MSASAIAVACNITVTGCKADSKKPAAIGVFGFTLAEWLDVMQAPGFGTIAPGSLGLQDLTFDSTSAITSVIRVDDIVWTHAVVRY